MSSPQGIMADMLLTTTVLGGSTTINLPVSSLNPHIADQCQPPYTSTEAQRFPATYFLGHRI